MTDFDPVIQRRLDDQVKGLFEEFGEKIEREEIAALMNDSAGRFAESAVMHDYIPPLAYRLAKERLRATARSLYSVDDGSRDVVFVSLSGGGRGQIAAALTTLLSGDKVGVHSAGTDASGEIDAAVKAVIEELGLDTTEAFAQPVTPEVLKATDLVVTMGHSVGEFEMPAGPPSEDWRIGDPVGAPLEEVRRVREDIERRVRAMLERLDVRIVELELSAASSAEAE